MISLDLDKDLLNAIRAQGGVVTFESIENPVAVQPNQRIWIEAEAQRLEIIRREQGDDSWAESLAASVVTLLTVYLENKNNPETQFLSTEAILTLINLTPQLLELYSHPRLGVGAAAGMIEELASRRFIPIDVNPLIRKRWDRMGKRS